MAKRPRKGPVRGAHRAAQKRTVEADGKHPKSRTARQPELPAPPGYVRDPTNRFVFHPAWPSASAFYRRLQDEMCERIELRGLPLPAEYEAWYTERNVETVRRALPPGDLIRYCKNCGRELRDQAGALLTSYDPPGRRSKSDHCNDRCQKQAQARRSRAKDPERKRRAEFKYALDTVDGVEDILKARGWQAPLDPQRTS